MCTIPPPGPTCRADFRSSLGDGRSSGPGVGVRVRVCRRWGARARGCRRRDDRRKGGRRRGGRRWGVREWDGRKRERGRSGRGSDDGDDDRRGGRRTLHLDRRKEGETGEGRRREEREGQDYW